MLTDTNEIEQRTANSGLAKVAVQYFADTFVVNQSLVLRINICGENPPPSPSRKPLAVILKDNDNEQNNNKFDIFTSDLFDGFWTRKEYW